MNSIMKFIKPYVKYIVFAVIASAMCMLTNVVINNMVKEQINKMADNLTINVGILVIQIILVVIVGMISSYFMTYLNGFYSNHIMADVRQNVIAHIKDVSIEKMEQCNYGDLISRMSIDMESVKNYAEYYLKDCIYVPIMIIGFSIYLAWQDWQLFACTMLPLIILVPLSGKLMAPIKFKQKAYVKQLGQTNDNIAEICSGAITMKAYELEDKLYQKYWNQLYKSLVISQKNDKLQYLIEPLSYLIMYLPVVICLVAGGIKVFAGNMTFGTLVIYSNMLGMLIDPLIRGYQLYVNSKSAFASIERVLEILELPNEDEKYNTMFSNEHKADEKHSTMYDDKDKVFDSKFVYKLKNVSFAYGNTADTQSEAVLKNVNIEIKEGNKIAFVGESGSGKSTLLKLLYKHYDSYEGTIELYGKSMHLLSARDIRSRIALISQDTYLFPFSIMDNIQMAKENATREEVIQAAKSVGAHKFIEELPNGYETNAGEAGTLLSGGQRQRIALARAVLKDVDIILLDEPTSALDIHSEAVITQMVEDLFTNKTVVCVAHRLPTIQNYDHILVLQKGKVIEQGTHQQLLSSKNIYEKMWLHFTDNYDAAGNRGEEHE